ncbi:hypothetical protein [Asanoa siamensis]|uniref:Uncharacterized protein n=1 Tax=Asanoa siamensis TaxID=926357 RepID=A0ABQ4CMA8_9ACTN|nr:hypothetical protein [Asanoa siamensis]GIF72418.1 hypothetical protein Asi02nite_19360 [Asanoa siamensis]
MNRDDHPESDLLGAYRRIAAIVDPPPADVLAAARAAFLTRDLDGAIAVLVADSRASVGYQPVRAEPDQAQGHWLLTFEGGGIRADLEVGEDAAGLRLLGLLSGTAEGDCELEQAGVRRPVEVDALGRFVVAGVSHGPIRLRCRAADGTRVTTAWVTI